MLCYKRIDAIPKISAHIDTLKWWSKWFWKKITKTKFIHENRKQKQKQRMKSNLIRRLKGAISIRLNNIFIYIIEQVLFYNLQNEKKRKILLISIIHQRKRLDQRKENEHYVRYFIDKRKYFFFFFWLSVIIRVEANIYVS